MLRWDASREEPGKRVWKAAGPLRWTDLCLWSKQCGRASAMLMVVWETLLAALLAAQSGRCSHLGLISITISLDALTHPRARGFIPMCKPRDSCPSLRAVAGAGWGAKLCSSWKVPARACRAATKVSLLPLMGRAECQAAALVTSPATSYRSKQCADQFLWQQWGSCRWQYRRGCFVFPTCVVLHPSYIGVIKLQNHWGGQGLLEIQSNLPAPVYPSSLQGSKWGWLACVYPHLPSWRVTSVFFQS